MIQPTSNGQGIYLISNQDNGAVYVGCARKFLNRWKTHRWALLRGKHQTPALQEDWNAYGPDVFVFDIAEDVEREFDLVFAEYRWMEHFRNAGVRLYNRQHPRHMSPDQKNAWLQAPIVRLRIERGLGVADLARLAKLSESTVIKVERGLIPGSPKTIAKIAQALGVDAQDVTPAQRPGRPARSGEREVARDA